MKRKVSGGMKTRSESGNSQQCDSCPNDSRVLWPLAYFYLYNVPVRLDKKLNWLVWIAVRLDQVHMIKLRVNRELETGRSRDMCKHFKYNGF